MSYEIHQWKERGILFLWMILATVVCAFVFSFIVNFASFQNRDKHRAYADCVRAVLERNKVDVAETMCAHLRR